MDSKSLQLGIRKEIYLSLHSQWSIEKKFFSRNLNCFFAELEKKNLRGKKVSFAIAKVTQRRQYLISPSEIRASFLRLLLQLALVSLSP